MSPYVMAWCLDKERIAAYKALVKAYVLAVRDLVLVVVWGVLWVYESLLRWVLCTLGICLSRANENRLTHVSLGCSDVG